jgi:hypothetical protein
MARIVLGLGTSHTPMLTLPAELWPSYAERDAANPELAFPPDGLVMSYQEARRRSTPSPPTFAHVTEDGVSGQAKACQQALDELSRTLRRVKRPSEAELIRQGLDQVLG